MKRFISILLFLVLCLGMSSAEGNEINVTLDGEVMILEEPVYIIDGRTMVPVKFVFEPLGLEVKWDGENRIASGHKEGLDIYMPIDGSEASINGETVLLDVPATIIHSRTYVPIRFVAESTGAEVAWNPNTRTVSIMSVEKYDHLSTQTILSLINQDTYDEDGPDMSKIKLQYDTVISQAYSMISDSYEARDLVKLDFVELVSSLGLILDSDEDIALLLNTFKDYRLDLVETEILRLKSEHEVLELQGGDTYYGNLLNNQITGYGYYKFSDGTALLGDFEDANRHGFVTQIRSNGFDYSMYNYNQNIGMIFSYIAYEDYDNYGLSYYKDGVKYGFEYYAFVNQDGTYSQRFINHEDDQLEYYVYEDGYQTFYTDKSGKRAISISPNDRLYIYPTDDTGQVLEVFDGMGYLEVDDLVYIGEFEDGNRAGGMYFDEDDLTLSENLMDTFADEIIAEIITDTQSDQEKIKAIHDYLSSHIRYAEANEDGLFDYHTHTAYGAFIDGLAVCDGYAEAFKYLLDKVNINNVLIFGEGESSGDLVGAVNHAWNLIQVDGVYYHYDLTWNDLESSISYQYYQKDSLYFSETHGWAIEEYQSYLD